MQIYFLIIKLHIRRICIILSQLYKLYSRPEPSPYKIVYPPSPKEITDIDMQMVRASINNPDIGLAAACSCRKESDSDGQQEQKT